MSTTRTFTTKDDAYAFAACRALYAVGCTAVLTRTTAGRFRIATNATEDELWTVRSIVTALKVRLPASITRGRPRKR
ncbi:MAG: hypothetical protein ABI119_13750 [Gemmatimonadaceae bacterium]